MRKKIKADSVDELFEIVRAIQNGEEPEDYVRRKAEEEKEAIRLQEAAQKEAALAERREKSAGRQNTKKSAAGTRQGRADNARPSSSSLRNRKIEEDDDEAFERLLADESDATLSAAFGPTAEKLAGAGNTLKKGLQSGVHRVEGLLRTQTEKNHRQKNSGKSRKTLRQSQPSAADEQNQVQPSIADEQKQIPHLAADEQGREQPSAGRRQERVRLADVEKSHGGRTHRRYGAKRISEEAETVGKRILSSLHMESSEEKQTERLASSHEILSDENEIDSIDLDTVQILDRLLDEAGTDNHSDSDAERPKAADAEDADSAAVKAARHGRLSDLKETTRIPDVKAHLRQVRAGLEEKGLGGRKLWIAGAAAVFMVAVLVFLLCVIGQNISLHRKQENVTADAGLTITVEDQPQEWCSSGELRLKVKVKSGTIVSVEVDGTVYEADEKGFVTAEVQDYLAEIVVVTDEGTLTAQVEIPKVDASAPVVSVDKSQGKITVTASDTRSGVASIWYAVTEEDDWIQLPVYQQYSEPISYEEDKMYYFYATDQAGNASSPIVTNMVTAEALSLSETELTLFPGETATLNAEVSPENAYVSELRYESSNTAVVTVSSSGLVTAVAEGGALIRVTADDLETVTCSVTVTSEQTVSISVIGDCTLGTYVGANTSTSFDAYYAMYGSDYFFENVRDILENDDITFANLEGTLTDETTPEDKTYAFKGDPSYTEILLDGSIEVVTLANNHSSDYGAQSLVDTKENLTDAGIEYCIGDTIAYEEVSGVKVAFIGIYELASGMDCESQVRETIAQAQEENAQLIIVAFHWGTEKETAADEIQQSLAHIAIDCGADLVVGHHPHVLQGIEKYNGKYIVYSLGNFCFGGNTNPSDKATMIFRQTFTVSSEGAAEDDNIEIIPCTVSSQTDYNDYRPTPAAGTTATEIMDRINEYSAAFGDITYTASTGL